MKDVFSYCVTCNEKKVLDMLKALRLEIKTYLDVMHCNCDNISKVEYFLMTSSSEILEWNHGYEHDSMNIVDNNTEIRNCSNKVYQVLLELLFEWK
jgi:hypothetical protein